MAEAKGRQVPGVRSQLSPLPETNHTSPPHNQHRLCKQLAHCTHAHSECTVGTHPTHITSIPLPQQATISHTSTSPSASNTFIQVTQIQHEPLTHSCHSLFLIYSGMADTARALPASSAHTHFPCPAACSLHSQPLTRGSWSSSATSSPWEGS